MKKKNQPFRRVSSLLRSLGLVANSKIKTQNRFDVQLRSNYPISISIGTFCFTSRFKSFSTASNIQQNVIWTSNDTLVFGVLDSKDFAAGENTLRIWQVGGQAHVLVQADAEIC
jgi:hypothetical protein